MKTLAQKMQIIMETVGTFPFAINSNPQAWIYEGEDPAGVDITVFESEEDVEDAVNENWSNMNVIEKSETFSFEGQYYDFDGNVVEGRIV